MSKETKETMEELKDEIIEETFDEFDDFEEETIEEGLMPKVKAGWQKYGKYIIRGVIAGIAIGGAYYLGKSSANAVKEAIENVDIPAEIPEIPRVQEISEEIVEIVEIVNE